jgi:N utilization substance protein B
MQPLAVAQLEKQYLHGPKRAYLYHFVFLRELAACFAAEKQIKQEKYLPSEADRQFSVRFFESSWISTLRNDETLNKAIRTEKLNLLIDQDVLQLVYKKLKESEPYQNYLQQEGSKADAELSIRMFSELAWLDEDFDQHLEDCFPNWDEDAETVVPKVLSSIRSWREGKPFPMLDLKIDSDSQKFVRELYQLALEHEEELEKLLEPSLKNWEIDRITFMDRLLLRLALVELLYFPSIPVKVSINEYIEISKSYSTPKSKDFINGVLDQLLKVLREEHRIQKRGRGLVE